MLDYVSLRLAGYTRFIASCWAGRTVGHVGVQKPHLRSIARTLSELLFHLSPARRDHRRRDLIEDPDRTAGKRQGKAGLLSPPSWKALGKPVPEQHSGPVLDPREVGPVRTQDLPGLTCFDDVEDVVRARDRGIVQTEILKRETDDERSRAPDYDIKGGSVRHSIRG